MNPFDAFGDWLGQVILWALDLVQSVGPWWGAAIAFAALFLETTMFIGLVVPGDTILLAAATAVDEPAEWAILFVAAVLGTLSGQSVGFMLGRWFGPRLKASRLGRRLGANWDRAEQYVSRRGGWAVFVSRFLPVLHALMPLTVGMSFMRYRRFIAWAAPAAVLWAGAYVTVGALVGGSFRAMVDRLHWAGYIFVGAIALFLIIVFLVRKLIARSAERAMAPDAKMEGDVPDHERG